MANSGSPLRAKHRALAVVAGVAALTALAACDPPFNLGQPSTLALENGASGGLATAKSFEITGSYTESGDTWSIDLQVVRPATQHVVVTKGDLRLEAIIFFDPTGFNAATAYFRGNQFLSQHMGNDPASRNLVRAAGNAWWKGSADQVPQLPDLTNGTGFRATFLGTALSQRTDHVAVDGVEAVDLSGPRADVFVAAAPPYQLLRLRMKKSSVIDGISDADLRFSNFDQDFKIAAPTDVIDFSNLSTLPPIYTVVSVDTSKCLSPCVVSATLKNLGGRLSAKAPSTITFSMVDAASKQAVASCQVQVKPDVGYNATTKVSCTMSAVNGQQVNAATVTATPDNPGHA
ncbi:MAG TPA: hypothetical protein VIO34_05825 [Candidatus Dormibacteraeota bacterium]